MEPGHTQSEGDSMHGRIEQNCRHKNIFTQRQWCSAMREAKISKPYNVMEIQQSQIFDYSELSLLFNWPVVKFTKLKEINYFAQNSTITVKYDSFESDSVEINILKKNHTFQDVKQIKLKQAYNELIPLPVKKQNDIKLMIKKRYIPSECEPFYNDLISI